MFYREALHYETLILSLVDVLRLVFESVHDTRINNLGIYNADK